MRSRRHTVAPMGLTVAAWLLAWAALAGAPGWVVRVAGGLLMCAAVAMGVWLHRSWRGYP